MAAVFWPGFDQTTPSTPGVFLPRFSVTRFTASALPLHEWVSKCCRARTLLPLPSRVAFTIRTWRRRTLRSAGRQFFLCQSSSPGGAAPARGAWLVVDEPAVALAVICLPPLPLCHALS